MVTLGNSTPQGTLTWDNLTLVCLMKNQDEKSVNHDSRYEHKALVTKTTSNIGRSNIRNSQNIRNTSKGRSKCKNKKDVMVKISLFMMMLVLI